MKHIMGYTILSQADVVDLVKVMIGSEAMLESIQDELRRKRLIDRYFPDVVPEYLINLIGRTILDSKGERQKLNWP